MNILSRLENLDLDSLDLLEKSKYNSCISFMGKAENLQCIINTSFFGDLSEGLQLIALEQNEENI